MKYKDFQELYAVLRGKVVEIEPKKFDPKKYKKAEEAKEEPKEEPKPKKSRKKKEAE